MQPHLRISKTDRYALLPGDPGRIDRILEFLDNPRDVNTNREFRTARGNYMGTDLTVISTGMGCPAAAVAVEELSRCGAETIVRVGTCGGLLREMRPGDIVIPDSAFCGDGTTREYSHGREIVGADRGLKDALVAAARGLGLRFFVGMNRTHDAFYEPGENFARLAGRGMISSEMECSALFLVSEMRNVRAGAVLVVNTPEPPEDVAENPDIIYRLSDKKEVDRGVYNAIRVSLEAVRIMENGDIKEGRH